MKKLDITPQMAVSAYNVLRDYASAQKDCQNCIFNTGCPNACCCLESRNCPEFWPDVEIRKGEETCIESTEIK